MAEDIEKCADIDQDKAIKKEMNRLKKIFKEIDPDKRAVVDGLIQNAAFTRVMLYQLQQEQMETGPIVEYDNGGGQSGVRISPASQQYVKLLGTYNQIIKNLVIILPKADRAQARAQADPLADFLNTE